MKYDVVQVYRSNESQDRILLKRKGHTAESQGSIKMKCYIRMRSCVSWELFYTETANHRKAVTQPLELKLSLEMSNVVLMKVE